MPAFLEKPYGSPGIGPHLIGPALLTVQFLYYHQGNHDAVLIETQWSRGVGE
jgi:hypothetical protein